MIMNGYAQYSKQPVRALPSVVCLAFSTQLTLAAFVVALLCSNTGAGAGTGEGTVSQTDLPGISADQPEAADPVEAPREPAVPSKRWLVVIDPGHGGEDSGEVGAGGAEEKNVTLTLARRIKEILDDTCVVLLTRNEDTTVPAFERTSKANLARGALMVSLHTGASASSTANGFELFVPPLSSTAAKTDSPGNLSRELAALVASSLGETTRALPRGIHSAPCRAFQGLDMPAVLVEVGYITNAIEEPLLVDEAYQRKIAEGIASGIQSFLSSSG